GAEDLARKLGKGAQPLRVALAGVPVSPSIDQTLTLRGKDETLARIGHAIDWIQSHPQE
ncbi:MAG: glutamate--tRNA ligase, partial [Ectothiorhodospiraceae bacterium]|nr:glutamate--tRNA ligase [Ectothiorhodospiraceae bacterium]